MNKKSEGKGSKQPKTTSIDLESELKILNDRITNLQTKQQTIAVKIKKLDENAVMPTYITDGSAGMDITAISREFDPETCIQVYHTGLAIQIPVGYVGLLFPKSGICKKTQRLTNCVGMIDSDYRGEIIGKFKADGLQFIENLKQNHWLFRTLLRRVFSYKSCYEPSDKILQMIIIPYPKVNLIEVEELDKTERGERGFGEMDLIQDTKA